MPWLLWGARLPCWSLGCNHKWTLIFSRAFAEKRVGLIQVNVAATFLLSLLTELQLFPGIVP